MPICDNSNSAERADMPPPCHLETLVKHPQPRPSGAHAVHLSPTGQLPQGGAVLRRGAPHCELNSIPVLGDQLDNHAKRREAGITHLLERAAEVVISGLVVVEQ